ncbi:MAG: gluconate 2-dehydrogenase subunit 3 family protein [Bryobacteraceae bacterium]|nr:gluconate 2-dehydrogenase subunit 3 family protein [Bryobacteraceae bacterium]
MSEREYSRRDLARIALAATAGGLTAEAAQHVHHAAAAETKQTGTYSPKFFTASEYRTLDLLAEMIVPGAREGGAKEFIDLLASVNEGLAAIYTGGLAWLDREMERRHGRPFAEATEEQRTAMLDLIAYRKNDSPELGPGIVFFDWARKMVVDAYYTSPAGIAALGFQGNKGMTEFRIPSEALEYALKRSGLE